MACENPHCRMNVGHLEFHNDLCIFWDVGTIKFFKTWCMCFLDVYIYIYYIYTVYCKTCKVGCSSFWGKFSWEVFGAVWRWKWRWDSGEIVDVSCKSRYIMFVCVILYVCLLLNCCHDYFQALTTFFLKNDDCLLRCCVSYELLNSIWYTSN